MLRVWSGESERVFAMMAPVLLLRHYESQRLLGNPEEFAVLVDTDEGTYESAAITFADCPRRGWYDLRSIRTTSIPPHHPPRWVADDGRKKDAVSDETLLGKNYRSVIFPGTWRTSLTFPGPYLTPLALVFFVRADLQAAGSEEIYYRTEPLAEKECWIDVTWGKESARLEQAYGWSYQLYVIELDGLRPGEEISMVVRSGGNAEVIGPVLTPANSLDFTPWLNFSSVARWDGADE